MSEKMYTVRITMEYTVEVEASSPDQALSIARGLPLDEWDDRDEVDAEVEPQ